MGGKAPRLVRAPASCSAKRLATPTRARPTGMRRTEAVVGMFIAPSRRCASAWGSVTATAITAAGLASWGIAAMAAVMAIMAGGGLWRAFGFFYGVWAGD